MSQLTYHTLLSIVMDDNNISSSEKNIEFILNFVSQHKYNEVVTCLQSPEDKTDPHLKHWVQVCCENHPIIDNPKNESNQSYLTIV